MDAPFEPSTSRRRFAQPALAQYGRRPLRRLSRGAVLRHRHRQDGRAFAAAAAMTDVAAEFFARSSVRRNRRVATIARQRRSRDGRRRLRRGPALRRLLQGDRLRRHDPGRAAPRRRRAARATLSVSFDANVAPGLDWTFEPETATIPLRTGATATVYFRVRNRSARETAAVAVFNVAPEVVGRVVRQGVVLLFLGAASRPQRNRRAAGRLLSRSAPRAGSHDERRRGDHVVLYVVRRERRRQAGGARAAGGRRAAAIVRDMRL